VKHLPQVRIVPRVFSSSEEDEVDIDLPAKVTSPPHNHDMRQADTRASSVTLPPTLPRVTQTRVITSICESAKMETLLEDVKFELKDLVDDRLESIAVAAEVVWSYPQVRTSLQGSPHFRLLNIRFSFDYFSSKSENRFSLSP